MALNLDSGCQNALALAKRAVPEGGALDVTLLLEALYREADLTQAFPEYSPFLARPAEIRAGTPAKVPIATSLQTVLQRFVESGDLVTPRLLFTALLGTDAARRFLAAKGMAPPAAPEAQTEAAPGGWRKSSQRPAAIQALSAYGRMLTDAEPPHKGVVEMEAPLRSLYRVLCKRKRNNAILVAPPGTGKSALVYELAWRLYSGHPSVPEGLRDLDIFELSPSFLRAGASMVGQYDERVKSLIQILAANPRIILFVDEIHSLLQSAMHVQSPFSQANESFKTALDQGQIKCIGCTTSAEYRHYIEPDEALVRRLGVIHIEPPSREATLRILKSKRARMEAHYAPLRIPDGALERALDLTEEHVLSRYQPDKSLQLLDDACAYCVVAEPRPAEVGEEALWRALEDIIGHSIMRPEAVTEEGLYQKLRGKIVGQDQALAGIARAVVAGLGSWRKHSGPRGVFFFCGPTGVGKTEAAVLLAGALGNGRENLIRIDCNTLLGSGLDSGPVLNRLIGVPPGYIGYARGRGGILSRVREMPDCVVLFDEIEKADPGIGKILLDILDEGRTEDVDQNRLDFRRSFLIFTSNAGCVYEKHRHIGFEEREGNAAPATPAVDMEALKAHFRALGYGQEFLGRIGHFFVFGGLERDSIVEIIQRQLASIRETASPRGYGFEWDDAVVPYLASSWQPAFGVRHLTTILKNRIAEQLSVAEAQRELKGVGTIRLEVLDSAARSAAGGIAGVAARRRQGEILTILIG